MSIDPFDDDSADKPDQKITDDEGTVDDKVKSRILQARQRVDQAEAALFVEAPTSDADITRKQQHIGYTTIVKQFIRSIKPLLTSGRIPDAEYYYSDVLLYEDRVLPPTGQRDWRRFAIEDVDNAKIKRDMGLSPQFDPPEPKRVAVEGLGELLDTSTITLRWSFDMLKGQGVATTDVENLQKSIAMDKQVYDSAVEAADAFLQGAGLGMEIGHRQTDDQDDDPF